MVVVVASASNAAAAAEPSLLAAAAIDRTDGSLPAWRQDSSAVGVDDDGKQPSRDDVGEGGVRADRGTASLTDGRSVVGRRHIIIFLWRCGGELFEQRRGSVIAVFLVQCVEVVGFVRKGEFGV